MQESLAESNAGNPQRSESLTDNTGVPEWCIDGKGRSVEQWIHSIEALAGLVGPVVEPKVFIYIFSIENHIILLDLVIFEGLTSVILFASMHLS